MGRVDASVATMLLAAISLFPVGPTGAQTAEGEPKRYRVVDGRVDRTTYEGYRRYSATCLHCHGPDGEGGSFAPTLIAAPLPADTFRALVLDGRTTGPSVMPGFADDPSVAPYVDAIYACVLARADGALGRGRPAPLD